MKVDFSKILDGLRPTQKVLFQDERTVLLEYSPQTGKTTTAVEWLKWMCLTQLKAGEIAWYAVPVWKQGMMPFDRMVNSTNKKLVKSVNKSDRQIRFRNGALLKFVTAEHPKSMFGDSVSAMIIDEASDMKDEAWPALFSRTAFTRGKVRIVGNRRGRGRFYEMCREAEHNGDTKDLIFRKMPAKLAVEYGIMAEDEYELQKSLLPEILFRELYDLEDVSGMNPFLGYEKCISDIPSLAETDNYGLDYARYQDYYALIGVDSNCHWTTMNVWQGIDSEASANRTMNIVQESPVLIDSTGVGDVHLDQLRKRGVKATGYTFTAKSRQALLENLATMVGQNAVRFPSSVAKQISRFEYVDTSVGTKFAAPESQHDDEVMAFALAAWKHRKQMDWNIF